MQRPGWVTALVMIQTLLALMMLGGGIYLLVLARSPEILNEADGADAAQGLRIAAAFCVPMSLVYAISAFGLLKRKLWGWWLGVILTVGAVVTLIYNVIDDGWKSSDASDIALPVIFVLLLFLFLLPSVRSHYCRRNSAAQKEVPTQAVRFRGKQS